LLGWLKVNGLDQNGFSLPVIDITNMAGSVKIKGV